MDVLQYYELKQKYQESMDKKKKMIKKHKTYSDKEKRTRIKALPLSYRCVNCGKAGGTIFEERNGTLKAVCGANPPCNLNINIKRKLYDNVRELEEKNNKRSETLKMLIIMTKLDYLFGLNNSKDEIVEKFNTLKNELAHISESELIIQKKYGDILSGVHREPLLNDSAIDLVTEIEALKKLYQEYLIEQRESYLTEMVEKYITVIKPLTEKIRDMNYGYYAIESSKPDENDDKKDDNTDEKKVKDVTYTLVAMPYRLEQLEQERK
jgi:hypothetical protein